MRSLNQKSPCQDSWLGIKNDYRTLVGLDELSLIEKEDSQDEDEENV